MSESLTDILAADPAIGGRTAVEILVRRFIGHETLQDVAAALDLHPATVRQMEALCVRGMSPATFDALTAATVAVRPGFEWAANVLQWREGVKR